jgi:hypothetical protein
MHHTGMHAVDGHARSVEPAGQLVGEQHVGELGLVVGRLASVPTLALEIFELDASCRMRSRGDVHDPRRGALLEEVEQQRRQQEVREVVQREGHLQPVDRHASIPEEGSRTVHKDVEPVVLGQNVVRQFPDRGLRGEVCTEELDLLVPGVLADPLHRGLTLLGIATDEPDARAQRGERVRGGLADARGGSP